MVKDADANNAEATPDAAPAMIGPYVVMRELGAGGMGVVFLCRASSGRLVAVKQIPEEYADDPAFRSRFRREIAGARRVSGVYTVPVVDADTDGPRPWAATVYIPGPTLDQAVRACGSFQEPALRALGTGLVEALQAVHSAGLVHRDLQPGNVLLAPDGPRVIDFGITKAVGETRLTRTGAVIGSPAFIAPEQIVSSHEVGPACDVFALAGVLVYAACGEGPFGPGDAGVLHRVVTDEPNLQGIPTALHPLLRHCLDKTPARRPALAQVLAELAPSDPGALLTPALREQLEARARDALLMATAPPPLAALPGTRRLAGRRRVLIGGLSALGVAAAGGLGWATLGGGRKQAHGTPLATVTPALALTDPPKPLWTTSVSVPTGGPPIYPFGSTLVLYGGTDSAAALDATTGAVRWSDGIEFDGRPNTTPLYGATSILGVTGTGLLAWGLSTEPGSLGDIYLAIMDPTTGWLSYRFGIGRSDSVTPYGLLASYGNTAYCVVVSDQAGTSSPVPTPTQLVETATAFDLGSGAVRWRQPVSVSTTYLDSYFGAPFAADQYGLYCTRDTSAGLTVLALNAADGSSRWSANVPAVPDSALPPSEQVTTQLMSSLVAASGLLITVNIKGGMTAYDTQSGRRRWATAMSGGTPPSVAGGLVLTNDSSRVYAVDLYSGEIKWTVESPVPLSGYGRTLAASDQVTAVLFDTVGGTLSSTGSPGSPAGCLVLRTSDGKQIWALREQPGPSATPSPSAAPVIGSAPMTELYPWTLAVQGSTVCIGGGGRVQAYRADAE